MSTLSTLTRLPGGNGGYLLTIDRCLMWLASNRPTARESFRTWFANEFNVGISNVSRHLQLLLNLNVLVDVQGNLELTASGEEFIQAIDNEAKARVLIPQMMTTFDALPEVLALFDAAGHPLHMNDVMLGLQPLFPSWTSETPYSERTHWLLSLYCLEQVRGQSYLITPFGHQIATQYPVNPPVFLSQVNDTPPLVPASPAALPDPLEQLISELQAAATDSHHPKLFEEVIARVFEALGFQVERLGEPGNTDVFASAPIGPDSYSLVIDAKSRADGKQHF